MAIKKTMHFFFPSDGACNFHRVLQPARFCHQRYDKDWHFSVGPGPAHDHEVYYFSGLPNVREGSSTLLEIQSLKRNGATFVWSVDDDWTSIPDWNPAKPDVRGLCVYDIMKQISDWIVVSTPYLASTFHDVKEKVLVAPNLLDLSMYPAVQREKFTDKDGYEGYAFSIEVKLPVRIVWVGSETHRGDVDEITEPLDEFIGKYCGVHNGNKATMLFSGMLPDGDITRKYLHKGLFHQPMVPFASYHSILTSMQPAIYLAPLAKIPFNRGKSNLRVIEGWALAAPSVATDWGEYGRTINDSVDGLLCQTSKEWFDNLVKLTMNHEHRVSLASHGRMKVEMEYNWLREECKQPWYDCFDKILGYKP